MPPALTATKRARVETEARKLARSGRYSSHRLIKAVLLARNLAETDAVFANTVHVRLRRHVVASVRPGLTQPRVPATILLPLVLLTHPQRLVKQVARNSSRFRQAG